MEKTVNLKDIYKELKRIKAAMVTKEELNQLRADLEVEDDGELTDWAKKELTKARKTPIEKYVSLDEIKQKVLAKK